MANYFKQNAYFSKEISESHEVNPPSAFARTFGPWRWFKDFFSFSPYNSIEKSVRDFNKLMIHLPIEGIVHLILGSYFILRAPFRLINAIIKLDAQRLAATLLHFIYGVNLLVNGGLMIALWPWSLFQIPLRLLVTAAHATLTPSSNPNPNNIESVKPNEEENENQIPISNDVLKNHILPLLNIKDLLALSSTSKAMYRLGQSEMNQRGKIYYALSQSLVSFMKPTSFFGGFAQSRTKISAEDLYHAYYGSEKLDEMQEFKTEYYSVVTKNKKNYYLFSDETHAKDFAESKYNEIDDRVHTIYKVQYFGPQALTICGSRLTGTIYSKEPFEKTSTYKIFETEPCNLKLRAGALPPRNFKNTKELNYVPLKPLNKEERKQYGICP